MKTLALQRACDEHVVAKNTRAGTARASLEQQYYLLFSVNFSIVVQNLGFFGFMGFLGLVGGFQDRQKLHLLEIEVLFGTSNAAQRCLRIFNIKLIPAGRRFSCWELQETISD